MAHTQTYTPSPTYQCFIVSHIPTKFRLTVALNFKHSFDSSFFSRNFEYFPVMWTLDKSEDLQTNDLEAVQRKRCGPTLADHRGSKCTGVECWLVMWRSLRARVWRIVLSMFLCKLYQAKILVSILYNCRVYLKVSVGMNMYTNRFLMIYIHTHTFIYHISSYFFICTICTHVTDSLPANSNTTFCISDNGFSSRKAGYCRAANGRWLCGICPEGEMDTISGYDFSVSKAFSLATKLDFWAYTVGLGRCFWKDRHKS